MSQGEQRSSATNQTPVKEGEESPSGSPACAAWTPEQPAFSHLSQLELRRAYEQLQEETHRRTTALATAAHELKTPLAIMSGYLELLLSGKTGPLSEQQRQILGEIESSQGRLQRFIQDFLTYSAFESGRLNLQVEAADLNACLSELYSFWLPQFQKKGVALYLPTTERVEPFPFDYAKVQHVVSNLLENAYKFTPVSGTVWLNAEPHFWERRSREQADWSSNRRRQADQVANAVRVTVADTGLGIDPEYHLEVFDDFFYLPGPEGAKEGVGLGLAIARRLVNAHGGKIWVESRPGAGSKFCFLLPTAPEPPLPGEAA